MSRKSIIACIGFCWVVLLAVTLSAQTIRPERSGVKPQVLSLPSGPGSVEGLGESFKPNHNSGMVSYQVKLVLPPAANGHKPDLALVYNGGSGNGSFGIGWNIPIPYVQRQTDKGLPTYTDRDTFIYYNQEELVPLADGTFHSKNEGEFVRLRRVGAYWEGTAKSGMRLIFGQSGDARITNSEGTFQWLLERSMDSNGNVVQFMYQQNQGQAYLKEIRYSLFDSNYHSVVFNYETRPDQLSDYRSRHKVTTAWRCAAIEVRSRGALQRRYQMEYLNTTVSLLRRVTLYGRDEQTTLPPITFNYTGLTSNPVLINMANSPPISFTRTSNVELIDADGDGLPDIMVGVGQSYRYYRNMGQGEWDRRATPMANSPTFALDEREVTLGDFNGDGIVGVARKGNGPGNYVFYPNTGDNRFAPLVRFENNPAYQFSDGSVQMVDLDFDKRPDVLQSTTDGRFFCWINLGNNRWSERIELSPPDPQRTLWTGDPRVQLADMNGDRLLDLVWVNWNLRQVEYYPLRGYNRLGGMRQPMFDAKVAMQNVPRIDPTPSGPNRPRLIDINNDGLADLVYVEARRVRYWLNLGNNRFGPEQVINGTPTLGGGFRFADITGNGTRGVLWYDDLAERHVYLDFTNGPKPNLLNRIENGLGREINFEYKNSTDHYVEARQANNPWCARLPLVVAVLSRLRIKDLNSQHEYITDFEYRDGYFNPDEQEFRGFEFVKTIERGDGTAPMLATLYKYNLGFDAKGQPEGSLKGKLLRVELLSEDVPIRCNGPDPEPTQLFRRELFAYETRTLQVGTNNVPVKYSFNSYKSTFIYEKTDQPREVAEEFDHDAFGNEIQHTEYNDITDGVIASQQRITATQYAMNMTAYIVDKPVRIYVTDGNGAFVSETLFYYDGPDYLGLPSGQVTRGNVTRKAQRPAAKDSPINVERKRYDQYGNVIGILDALGNPSNPPAGHARAITYDPVFHTHPVEERIYKEGDPLVLTAEYDYGFGMVKTATDTAGQPTSFVYDALGRLEKIVRPGDTEALPTEQYTYTLGNPVSRLRVDKRQRSGQPGTVVIYQYVDGLGRKLQTKEVMASNQAVMKGTVTFNLRGTVREEYLPYFTNTAAYEPPDASKPKTVTLYDSLGRAVERQQPVGGFVRTIYRPLKRIVYDEENTNPSSPHYNKPRTLTYDGFERLVGVEERNGKDTYLTTYGYDLLNNLTYVRDTLGNEITAWYDGLSRMVQRLDPDRGPLTITYDEAGNLSESLDGNGQIVRNTYDAVNRLKTQVSVSLKGVVTPHATYHYDNDLPTDHRELTNTVGRLAYVEDQTGRSIFSFDAHGNINRQIRDVRGVDEYAMQFTYDAMERIADLTYPDGMRMSYTYDARGLLAAIPGYAPTVEHTAAGQFARIRFQNGAETTYGYDDRQRLVALRTISPTATSSLIQDLNYTLDGVSNVLRIVDGRPGISDAHNASEDFTYDDVYRLTRTRGRYGEINFAYDAVNNLISKTSSVDHPDLSIGPLAYGKGAGPHQVISAGNRAYTYDANGNLLSKTGFTYGWDAKNRLVRVVREDGGRGDFTYDFADRRVSKVEASSQVIYINKYAERRNGRLVKYVFAGGRRVAQVDDRGVAYYHPDQLGSTNVVTDATGAVVERIQYYAFGTERIREGSFQASYRYIDRELDESTELYYLIARHYDHSLGMFLSCDPVSFDKMLPQTINPYDYSHHNPYKYIDPDGLFFKSIAKFFKSVGETIEKIGKVVAQIGQVLEQVGKVVTIIGQVVSIFAPQVGGYILAAGQVITMVGQVASRVGQVMVSVGQGLQGLGGVFSSLDSALGASTARRSSQARRASDRGRGDDRDIFSGAFPQVGLAF